MSFSWNVFRYYKIEFSSQYTYTCLQLLSTSLVTPGLVRTLQNWSFKTNNKKLLSSNLLRSLFIENFEAFAKMMNSWLKKKDMSTVVIYFFWRPSPLIFYVNELAKMSPYCYLCVYQFFCVLVNGRNTFMTYMTWHPGETSTWWTKPSHKTIGRNWEFNSTHDTHSELKTVGKINLKGIEYHLTHSGHDSVHK